VAPLWLRRYTLGCRKTMNNETRLVDETAGS
jgi:hypothetical protein